MPIYPTDGEAKQTILEVGRRMFLKNYVAANDGNISCKVSDNVIWTTPSGVSKGYMTEDMLIKISLDGIVIQSGAYVPSSEIKMHMRVYSENPEVTGVVHAHPPIGTSFAIAGICLDKAIYPEALVNLGSVPCVHYETPGSQGVADSVAPYCKDYNALLLGNHGVLTWGGTLMEAYFRLESLENYAAVTMYTGYILGKFNTLGNEQINELIKIRQNQGITGKVPTGTDNPNNLFDVVNNNEL